MSPPTMHGKVFIEEILDPRENRFNNDYFDRTIWFIEDLISNDALTFGNRYLHLASYEELYDDIIEFFKNIKNPNRGLRHQDFVDGLRYMVNIIPNKQRTMCTIDNSKKIMCVKSERLPIYDIKDFNK